MQMMVITSSYDMNWPPEVTDFLLQIAPLMEFQRMLVAFDCFMDPRDVADIGEYEFEAREDEFRITQDSCLPFRTPELVPLFEIQYATQSSRVPLDTDFDRALETAH